MFGQAQARAREPIWAWHTYCEYELLRSFYSRKTLGYRVHETANSSAWYHIFKFQ